MQSAVYYLGPPGSHTHQACLKTLPTIPSISCTSIDQVMTQSCRSTENELGFVPIENSTFGPVLETLDSLNSHSLLITHQVQMPIRHFLLSNAELRSIDKLYSHPQACFTFYLIRISYSQGSGTMLRVATRSFVHCRANSVFFYLNGCSISFSRR